MSIESDRKVKIKLVGLVERLWQGSRRVPVTNEGLGGRPSSLVCIGPGAVRLFLVSFPTAGSRDDVRRQTNRC